MLHKNENMKKNGKRDLTARIALNNGRKKQKQYIKNILF